MARRSEGRDVRESPYTQEELKATYRVKVVRQPKSETMVFDIVKYLGELRIENNTYGDTYSAHELLVDVHTKESQPLKRPRKIILEIPSNRWDRGKWGFDPPEMTGRWSIRADEEYKIVSLRPTKAEDTADEEKPSESDLF